MAVEMVEDPYYVQPLYTLMAPSVFACVMHQRAMLFKLITSAYYVAETRHRVSKSCEIWMFNCMPPNRWQTCRHATQFVCTHSDQQCLGSFWGPPNINISAD